MLVDIEKGVLVGLIEKRAVETAINYPKCWREEALRAIDEVGRDLWKPYKKVAEKLMPEAGIVADIFHVMKQVNQELDRAKRKTKKAVKKLENGQEKEKIVSGLKRANTLYSRIKIT